MEAVSLAGSIIGILDVASRVVSNLYDLAGRYRHANESLVLLTSHVVPLRTALEHILQWVQLATPNHDLEQAVSVSISGCRLLLCRLETRLIKLRPSGSFEWAGKLMLALSLTEIKERQNQLDHQINALQLLLTICKAPTAEQQNIILRDKATTDTISIVNDDAITISTQIVEASLQPRDHIDDVTSEQQSTSLSPDLERLLSQAPAYQARMQSPFTAPGTKLGDDFMRKVDDYNRKLKEMKDFAIEAHNRQAAGSDEDKRALKAEVREKMAVVAMLQLQREMLDQELEDTVGGTPSKQVYSEIIRRTAKAEEHYGEIAQRRAKVEKHSPSHGSKRIPFLDP